MARATVEAEVLGIAPEGPRARARMDARLIVAITAVWLLWGSTYAAMRYAVGTMPPFAMASVRFTIAGAILFAICLVRGRVRPTRRDLVRAVVTGATLLLFGNGMTAWTVQYLPSGVNALLLSVAPIWMALIAFVWGGERPTRLSLAGMLLGLAGIALLVRPSAASPLPLWPVIVSIFAGVAWSFGSIYQRRMGRSGDVVLGTALQMLAGGLLLGLEAALTGQWSALHIHAVSAASWCALGWLIVFGGVIAYSAYLYTMHAASTALASTYAYVNPIVAVALGFVLFGERLTPIEMVASAIIVTGVALMMLPPRATAVRVGGG